MENRKKKDYQKHRENRLTYAKEYQKKNRDKIRETKRSYRKRNPEIIAHLKARRSARERGAIGSHTLQEWNNLKIKFHNRCAFCFKEKKLTKDHILPLIAGGSDYIENIQPLCRECNSRKGKSIKFQKESILETII
jgi:5-methylcytosine-specific restriction endonuclease McrA